MNPNSMQAIENEQAGEEEEQEDIDYDALYGGIDVNTTPPEPTEKMKNDYLKIFGDVAKQGIKETLIGLGGAYGDLTELAGLEKVDQERNKQDFQTLERLNDPNYSPTQDELEQLSEDPTLSKSFNLPSSQDFRNANEAIGGPGEAQTTPGKYAGRIGKIYGQGLAFGVTNPIPSIVAGGLGQLVEEKGGRPLTQAAAEIVGLLATPSGKAKALTSSKDAVKNIINELRTLGYNDEQITLAINSAHKNSRAANIASKGKKTEQAFEDFAEHSDDLISNILTKEVPGLEKNIEEVHQLASDAYGQVAKEGSQITIKDSSPFVKSVKFIENELSKNLGKSEEAKSFIKRINDAAEAAQQSPTAESMMNFYKELNKAGKWMDRSEKDRLLSHLKTGIKDTFKSQGKEGVKLAEDFEKVNKGIRKAYLAEDLNEVITKSKVDGKIDYKKLNKSLDNKENVKIFEEVLGKEQAKNVKTISNIGKQVKDFDKSWKVSNSLSSGTKLDTLQGAGALYFLYQGDYEKLAYVLGTKGGTTAVKKLAEKSLTDPKFQNLLIKGLHAVKTESPRLMKSANEGVKKYLEEEGLDIDL